MASHLDRIVYLNGQFIRGGDARISIFDRGLLFADAVYEGLGIRNGRIVDFARHMARLRRSLGELNIPAPLTEAELDTLLARLIAENQMDEGFCYLHITRGGGGGEGGGGGGGLSMDRDYVYPPGLTPTVFAFVQPAHAPTDANNPSEVTMRTHPDLRWRRRDIKTSNLLGQVMAINHAHSAGDYEALLVNDDGMITEGGASSFFIVKDGQLFVRPVTNDILHGVTRQSMLQVAAELGVELVEAPFSLDQAFSADEAFITGASSYIQPVVAIDGRPVSKGQPGPLTRRLLQVYLERIDRGEG